MQAAPLHSSIADGPEDGAAAWLTTADGVRLRAAHWGADARGGTVLLFPGRTEYVEKYGRTARILRARGYATLTVDWRGQGMAARLQPDRALGHVRRFLDYQHDVEALVTHARAIGLPEPFYLLAHSMGGCIGLRALMRGLPVRAACFSAPMWGIRMAPAMRPVAWTLSSLSRPVGLGERIAPGQHPVSYLLRTPFETNSLTGDAETYAFLQGQLRACPDLALGGPSLHWLNESLREMRQLARLPAPALPCLTILGSDDVTVDAGRITQRMAGWTDGRLIVMPGVRHEPMMEGGALLTRVFDLIAATFATGEDRADRGGDRAEGKADCARPSADATA